MDTLSHRTPDTDWRAQPTISVEEAGKILGVGRSTAYALAQPGGVIPTLKLGRRIVVPVAKLRALLGETHENSATAGGDGAVKATEGTGHATPYTR